MSGCEINFDKLKKELNLSIDADQKYERENAAKFRAVEQKVGSYEEFCDIVKASHLKPLEKPDKESATRQFAPWNTHASDFKEKELEPSTEVTDGSTTVCSHSKISSLLDFQRVWQPASEKTRRKLVCESLSIGDFHTVFAVDLPVDLFTEILNIFAEALVAEDTSTSQQKFTFLKVNAMCSSKRFKLALDFMDSKQEESVKTSVRSIISATESLMAGSDEYVKVTDAFKTFL